MPRSSSTTIPSRRTLHGRLSLHRAWKPALHYDRLICSPLSERLISTNLALPFSGSEASVRLICTAASGSLATMYR